MRIALINHRNWQNFSNIFAGEPDERECWKNAKINFCFIVNFINYFYVL